VEPGATAPVTSVPPEPAFNPPAVVPTGAPVDEDLVLTPAGDEGKPGKGETAKPPKSGGPRQTCTVAKGDSLWLISRMYDVSVSQLAAENGISQSATLKVGQVLKLPAGANARPRDRGEIKRVTAAKRPAASTAPAASAKPKAATTAKTGTGSGSKAPAVVSGTSARTTGAKEPVPTDGIYTVKSGDNPWTIARKFGVKHEELLQWNGYKSTTVLQIGDKVKLRPDAAQGIAGATKPAAPTTTTAIVVPPTPPTTGAVLPETTPVTVPGTATPAATPGTTLDAAPGAASAGGAPTTPAAGGAPATETLGNPPATGTAPTAPAGTGALDLPKKLSHTVTEGETLEIIAEMYGTTVDAVKKENPTIKSNADLLPNTKLMVPYR